MSALAHGAKPACLLTSSCAEGKWIKKTRKTRSAESSSMVEMEFLCLKFADDCNHDMEEVDVANQKRGNH